MVLTGLVLAGLVFEAGCAGAQREPRDPRPAETLENGFTTLPSWTRPDGAPAPATTLAGPPRETVSIRPPPKRDPVDVVLSRSRRRIGNLSLHQAPVDETLKMFASMGRFNVVMAGEIGSRKVSLELQNVTLAGAFRAVLASARLEARVLNDDILEVRAAGQR